MPPCITTSVWPSPAMASADANGSIVSRTPLLTLDDARTQLVKNNATVARSTVARPRESTVRDPREIALCGRPASTIGVPGVAIGGDRNDVATCLQVRGKHLELCSPQMNTGATQTTALSREPTGGAGGIGAAACRALAAEGAKVVVADLSADAAQAVAEGIVADGGSATSVGVDVADRPKVQAMVRTAVETFGELNVIFNNAGMN